MRIRKNLLRQRVTVEVYKGTGAYGEIYDPPKEERCRIEPRRKLVRDREGSEVVAEATAFFLPEVVLPPQSRVTWEGKAYTVIESRPHSGPRGEPHHVEAVMA